MNQLPDSAMGALRLMPSKAIEVANFSMQIIKAVQNGEANPLEVLIMLRSLEAVSEMVREEIQDNIINEASKYPEKKFNAFGAIVEKTELGTKYDYLGSGDREYEELHAEAETAKSRLKERETFLRAVKDPVMGITRHGEEFLIKPVQKRSTSGVKVYLANIK